MEGKKIWESKTFWMNIVSVSLMMYQSLTDVEVIPMEAQATLLGAINIALRMITGKSIQWMVALPLMLLLGGCARNTNSFNIGGTGMYLQTPVGMIALGNFEAHVATSELYNEELLVTDEKFFEGSGSLTAEGGEGAGSALNTQRSYSMRVSPVETTVTE